MTLRRDPGTDCRLYLEDLHVGQRFVSRSHAIDEEQIKAFAAQFDSCDMNVSLPKTYRLPLIPWMHTCALFVRPTM